MPVKFKGHSEYQCNFSWDDSFRAAAHANPDYGLPVAGVPSADLGVVQEPPLQRKKKPGQLPHHSPYFRDEPKPDDYILIGDQSKFAPSIKYKTSGPITEKRTTVSAIRDKQNEPKSDRTPPPAPRVEKPPVKPAPKVVVNPGGPKNGKYQSSKDEKQKGKHSDAKENRPPPAPKVHVDHGGHKQKPNKEHQQPKKSAIKPSKISDKQQNGHSEPLHPQPKVSKEEPVKKKREEKAVPKLAKSAPAQEKTIPDDYAMKYRAGIAPSRPLGPKRLTEYQMQYKWRNASKSSPLLAAESVVYNSNPQVAPFKSDNISRQSEYKARFGEYDIQPVSLEDEQLNGEAKKSAMKRSKSMSAISPDKLDAAGTGKKITSDNKRLIKESVNPLRLHFPHGKQRSYNSEYSANFKSPTNFAYEDGAWKGADPPHLELQDDTVAKSEQDGSLSNTRENWYAEVVELRKKAQEYKKRAHGTHFGREHLAQLLARQTEMWDTVSNSSTLSALSLEPAGKKSAKASEVSSNKKEAVVSRKKPTKAKEAWSVQENYSYPDSERTLSPRSGSPRFDSEIGSIPSPEDDIVSASLSPKDEDERRITKDEHEGRIPTPTLKTVPSTFKPRHHLDRTTPAVGGALLTSPPRRGTSSSTRSSVDPRYKADDESVSSREHQRGRLSPRSPQVALSESDDNDWSHIPVQKQKSTPPKTSQVRCTCSRHSDSEDDREYENVNFSGNKRPVKTSTKRQTSTLRNDINDDELPYDWDVPGYKSLPPSMLRRKTKPNPGSPERSFEHSFRDYERISTPPPPKGAPPQKSPTSPPRTSPMFYTVGGKKKNGSVPGTLGKKNSKKPLTSIAFPDKRDTKRHATLGTRPNMTPPRSNPKPRGVDASPTFGMPTRDSHVLVDEEASVDRPLATDYVHSPEKRASARKLEFQRKYPSVNIPATLKETLREDMHTPPNSYEVSLDDIPKREPDEDVLSFSARSVASSISMASEVLRRAERNREEFWGSDGNRRIQRNGSHLS